MSSIVVLGNPILRCDRAGSRAVEMFEVTCSQYLYQR
jgi:hypothetical protein